MTVVTIPDPWYSKIAVLRLEDHLRCWGISPLGRQVDPPLRDRLLTVLWTLLPGGLVGRGSADPRPSGDPHRDLDEWMFQQNLQATAEILTWWNVRHHVPLVKLFARRPARWLGPGHRSWTSDPEQAVLLPEGIAQEFFQRYARHRPVLVSAAVNLVPVSCRTSQGNALV